MSPRLWPLAIALVALPLVCWAQAGPSSADTRPQQRSQLLVGAGSCAASACHNNSAAKGDAGGEHRFWITRDPHAKAYEILFDAPAKEIQQKLHRPVAAHEDQLCLSCHASPDFDVKHPPKDAPYFKTDGVSCESCHGPAKNWIAEHHLETWRTKLADEKASFGMNDTQSLLGRAQACVKCHVGAPGMEVDHDLIAAGHPRLNFEFSAFHAGLPKHWPSAKDRVWPRGGTDLEARAWVVGQLVSAQAAVELLADRAGDKGKAWPQFGQHDCAACHHSLQPDSVRQKKGFGKRTPGAMPWGNYVTMLPVALESFRLQGDPSLQQRVGKFQRALADLRHTMDRSAVPDRKIVAGKARVAADLLKPLLAELNRELPTQVPMEKLFQYILTVHGPKAASSADEITQLYLGLAALHQGRQDTETALSPATLKEALHGLTLKLGLPKSAGVPQHYDPSTIRTRLHEFNKIGAMMEQ